MTHPCWRALDGVTSDNEAIPRVRSPEFKELSTCARLQHPGTSKNDTGRSLSYFALPAASLRYVGDVPEYSLNKVGQDKEEGITYLKTNGLSLLANLDRMLEFIV